MGTVFDNPGGSVGSLWSTACNFLTATLTFWNFKFQEYFYFIFNHYLKSRSFWAMNSLNPILEMWWWSGGLVVLSKVKIVPQCPTYILTLSRIAYCQRWCHVGSLTCIMSSCLFELFIISISSLLCKVCLSCRLGGLQLYSYIHRF